MTPPTDRPVVLPTGHGGHAQVDLLEWDHPTVARRLVNWLRYHRHHDVRLTDVTDIYHDPTADTVVIRTANATYDRHRISLRVARQLRREASLEAAGVTP